MPVWNPWHGCHKISPGCQHCYVYRGDARYGRNPDEVHKNGAFGYPVDKFRKNHQYKLQTNEVVYTCMTSDFFVEEADEWRPEVWRMIKERSDLHFYIITKRIDRMSDQIPSDWGDGYDNVTICPTCENQKMTDYRLPIALDLPIKHLEIIHEPMLERIDIRKYLATGRFRKVIAGGESGQDARTLDIDWILDTARQCEKYGVKFTFKQTGAKFIDNGQIHSVARNRQMPLAEAYGISTEPLINDAIVYHQAVGVVNE